MGRTVLLPMGVLWLAAVTGGSLALFNYANTPGRDGCAPRQWVADSAIKHDSGIPTLVMFAHPRCPCTRASIGELNSLMAHCRGKVSANVVFYRPKSAEQWPESDLWRSAAAIPGVKVRWDDDGIEARRFHAQTSGSTLLYDSQGRLLFSGGITGARGHAGDNAGHAAVAALLLGSVPDLTKTPVFGCALTGSESKCQEGGSSCHL